MKEGSRLVPGLLLAIVGAMAFSAKAIVVKLAYRHGVDPVTLIALRMLIALPIFVAMGWWAGRGKEALSGRDWIQVAALGATGYYLSSFLDFSGLQFITASLERLILYLNPTLVVLLAWAVNRTAPTARQWLGMALGYCGAALVLGQELRLQGSDVALGSLLVFGSAATYAVYFVYAARLVQRIGSLRLVGLATSVACVCCIAQFLLLRPLEAAWTVGPEVLWLSLVNATLCTAIPVLAVMMAIERIGPALTAQVSLIGPLSTILMGVFWLGEPLTMWMVAGTAIVFAGIFVFGSRARAGRTVTRS